MSSSAKTPHFPKSPTYIAITVRLEKPAFSLSKKEEVTELPSILCAVTVVKCGLHKIGSRDEL